MNVHFPLVEKKSQLFSYILVAFAVLSMLTLVLRVVHHAEFHLSIPSPAMDVVRTGNINLPVAIPAPLPPAEQAQTIATPEPVGNSQPALVPQAIAAPMPSVP